MTRADDLGDNAALTPNDALGDVHAGPTSTRFVRVRDMVHLRGCFASERAAAFTPWHWAEGKPLWRIAESRKNGVTFCGHCIPLNASCNVQGPAGRCDLPPHAGEDHEWSDPGGSSAHWRGDFNGYGGDPWDAEMEKI